MIMTLDTKIILSCQRHKEQVKWSIFVVRGKIYNRSPEEVKKSESKEVFMKLVHTLLIQREYYTVEEYLE